MRPRNPAAAAAVALVALIAGCTQPQPLPDPPGPGPAPAPGATPLPGPGPHRPEPLRLTSPAFGDGERIPEAHSCRGGNVSPPLAFHGVPPQARVVALVLDDPDGPRGVYTHWTAWDLPPALPGLDEGANVTAAGGAEGNTTKGVVGYFGPCADKATHRYVFHLVALREPLGLPRGAPVDAVRAALADRALGEANLTGLYGPAESPASKP